MRYCFPSMLLFTLLGACAQQNDEVAQPPAIVSERPLNVASTPAPMPRTRPPTSTSVATRTATAATTAEVNRPIAATATGSGVGVITGYRSTVITLYSTDNATSGVEVAAASFGKPVPVLAVSAMNKRLKVGTSNGDRWIDPIDVEYSGTLSEGQPAIRTKKHSAGGRGID
jgi:hypothetical protein